MLTGVGSWNVGAVGCRFDHFDIFEHGYVGMSVLVLFLLSLSTIT